jgi:signal recognition particle receptor subunit beta
MALFNHATKELTAKIVFYGPGLCGKTTNLKILHQRLERGAGKLLSLSTAQDRTIYFDLLPIELGNIKGYTVRFQVCTVPGQVFYNETRRIVLRGVDGLVFVVDSQWSMLSHNLESFQNLRENLANEKIPLESLPVVIQYNKRDLPSALSVEALQESLGFQSYPYVEAVASEGMGVLETFKLASKLTFVDLLRRLQRGWQPPSEPEVPAAESSLGSASAPGGSTQPFFSPGPAVSISAPAPEPEESPAAAPVLAMAGSASASAADEEPSEWVPPSAEGTFADLSDDSLKISAARAQAAAPVAPAPAASIAAPPPARTESVAGVAAPAGSGERPRSRPEMTAPVTPLDDKLNAVLAEARRAATGRVSGSFRREDTPLPETARADARRMEALEKALEAEREERRQLAAALESEKGARDVAALRADETYAGLKAAADAAMARANAAHEVTETLRGELAEARAARDAAEISAREASQALTARLDALRTEVEENRRGLSDAVAVERAARESAEAAARDASESLSARLAGLAEEVAAAKAAAEAWRATSENAAARARRLEDALRTALSDTGPES